MSNELPEGWITTRISKLAETRSGGTPSTAKREYWDNGDIPWINSGALKDCVISQPSTYITKLGSENSAAKLFPKNTVVIALTGATTGRVGILDFACSANQSVTGIFPSEAFLPSYVFNFLRSARPDVLEFAIGSAQPHINKRIVDDFEVPLAPVGEQRRIVAKLEMLLGKVDASQQRLAKMPVLLKRFRQSVLAAACSSRLTADWRDERTTDDADDADGDTDLPRLWKSVEFGALISDGPQNGLYKPASFYGDGTLIVRIDAFYDGTIAAWDELKRVRLTEKECSQFALSNGDILVNRVNSPKFLGKSALVRHLKEPCVYESNMMRLRLDIARALPDYAILYLRSLQGLVELRKNAKHAVNQSSINQEDAKSAMFNLPPLAEQQEIVRRVEQLFTLADQIEARLEKACAQMERLTPSLLARAFRGELVPQDPNDEPASVLLERIKQKSSSIEPKKRKAKRAALAAV